MTAVIEANNSYSRILGLTSGPFNALRKELSYELDANAAFFSGKSYNRTRYMIDKKGEFPTGLLPRVEKFLKSNNIPYSSMEYRKKSNKLVNHKPKICVKLHKWQDEAACLLERKHRGIISAVTGSGKSLVIALITARLSVRTLIVVPNLEIKKQLTKTFLELFSDMSNITIENIDSSALKSAADYDLLIIDEAHHVAAKTYHKLNKSVWKGIYYRAFLTATPFRNRTEETMLFEGIAGQVIYSLSYKDAVKNKYVAPIDAYYIEIPKQDVDGFTWAQVYSQLVVNNEVRNQILAKLLLTLQLSGVSTLCLVKEIAHGNKLANLTGLMFAHGQDETTRQHILDFNKKEILSLIGTNGIIGEGVDTKPCEFVVIAGLGKAKSAFMQQVGRAIRIYPGKESAKIIIIKDFSHKFTRQHYKEQCKVLKEEYGVIPQRLELE
jgi:superfamily II DNA or RNA helicase